MELQQQSPREIRIYDDLDAERYFEFNQFGDFLRLLRMFSPKQAYYYTLGISGFRTEETCKLKKSNLLFHLNPPMLLNSEIGKPKKKNIVFLNQPAIVVKTKIHRIEVPSSYVAYMLEYIRLNRWRFSVLPDGDFYLFPGHGEHQYKDPKSISAEMSRLRKWLVKLDPVKWEWVYDICHTRVDKRGFLSFIYRFSAHAFRHSRITWQAMIYIAKGVVDPLLMTKKFAAHDLAKTTQDYISARIVKPFKAPDLGVPIFSKDKSRQVELKRF